MNVLVTGDFVPKLEVEEKINNGIWKDIFAGIKNDIIQSDLSVINLECPIVENDAAPIAKVGPNIKCSKNVCDLLKYSGFNLVTLANNHFLDYGESAAITTMDVLKKSGLDCVGGGTNLEDASKIFYFKKDKETLAIINCCENEFSIATESTVGSNPLNPVAQWYNIQEASQKADYVLVIVHGGHELYQYPSPRMQKLYRFFIDAGADVVVNHHQHCYSGYEVYRGKPIFYGLGNFCFPNYKKRSNLWNEGCMVKISFPSMDFQVIPYKQVSGGENVVMLSSVEKKVFFDSIKLINQIISDEVLLKKEFSELVERKGKSYLLNFIPLPLKLNNNLILKLLLSKKRLLRCLNIIRCESHRDILVESIKKHIERL
jgi:poly-gamma-glutamate synthesis protein (capsule biosynthesis protein)